MVVPAPWFMYCRNPAATSWFLLCFITTSDDPPFSAVAAGPPDCKTGIGATRQFPLAAATPDSRLPGIHAPVTRLAIEPLPRAVYHWVDHEEIGESNPPWTIWFHSAVNFFEPGSCRLIVTFLVPLTAYGCPPAS